MGQKEESGNIEKRQNELHVEVIDNLKSAIQVRSLGISIKGQ